MFLLPLLWVWTLSVLSNVWCVLDSSSSIAAIRSCVLWLFPFDRSILKTSGHANRHFHCIWHLKVMHLPLFTVIISPRVPLLWNLLGLKRFIGSVAWMSWKKRQNPTFRRIYLQPRTTRQLAQCTGHYVTIGLP